MKKEQRPMETIRLLKRAGQAAVLSLLCFFTSAIPAQTMFGTPDCGQWIQQKRQPDRAWLLGYMSGLNVRHASADRTDGPLEKIGSVDQIFLWMDNYCTANPLHRVATGGWVLFQELLKK